MNNQQVTINLTLENVDVVLNALAEKSFNVNALREKIYNEVKSQVVNIEENQEQEERK